MARWHSRLSRIVHGEIDVNKLNSFIDINQIIEEHINLSESVDLSNGKFEVVLYNNFGNIAKSPSLSVKYSTEIDDYSNATASLNLKVDSSFDAEWKTTTKLEEVSFTTTFGIIKENNTNSNNHSLSIIRHKLIYLL